jgi:hypothetical protein
MLKRNLIAVLPGLMAGLGVLGGFGVMSSQAHASTILATDILQPQTVVTVAEENTPGVAYTISSTFPQFPAALGTLTGVTFAYDYQFSVDNAGGGGGGGAAVSGPVDINGSPTSLDIAASTGGFGGGGPFAIPLVGNTDSTYTVTGDLSSYIGSGSYNFDYLSGDPSAPAGPGGEPTDYVSASPGFTLDLLSPTGSPSYVSVSYTYTPAAVPEPASVGGLGAAAIVLLARRKQKLA